MSLNIPKFDLLQQESPYYIQMPSSVPTMKGIVGQYLVEQEAGKVYDEPKDIPTLLDTLNKMNVAAWDSVTGWKMLPAKYGLNLIDRVLSIPKSPETVSRINTQLLQLTITNSTHYPSHTQSFMMRAEKIIDQGVVVNTLNQAMTYPGPGFSKTDTDNPVSLLLRDTGDQYTFESRMSHNYKVPVLQELIKLGVKVHATVSRNGVPQGILSAILEYHQSVKFVLEDPVATDPANDIFSDTRTSTFRELTYKSVIEALFKTNILKNVDMVGTPRRFLPGTGGGPWMPKIDYLLHYLHDHVFIKPYKEGVDSTVLFDLIVRLSEQQHNHVIYSMIYIFNITPQFLDEHSSDMTDTPVFKNIKGVFKRYDDYKNGVSIRGVWGDIWGRGSRVKSRRRPRRRPRRSPSHRRSRGKKW